MRSYNNQLTRIISFSCDLHLTLSSITLYLVRVNTFEFSIMIAFLLFLPVSVKISSISEKVFTSISPENTLGQGTKSNISPINLIHFTNRMLKGFDFDYCYYSKNINSVILEEIITDHILTCVKYPNCFCDFKVFLIRIFRIT